MTALDAPPALRAVADLNVEAPHNGPHHREVFLILRRDALYCDRAATIRTPGRQRCFMDFIDLRRPPAACLPPVLRTGAPSRTLATTLPPLFGEGRRLAETRAPRRVKLLLEPSRAALPAIPVALGARQILAQLRVLTLQLFDTAVPRTPLPPGCIRVIGPPRRAHTEGIGSEAPHLQSEPRLSCRDPLNEYQEGFLLIDFIWKNEGISEGEVAYTDYALGPLLELAGASEERPTIVVVTADHGEALGEHGERTHGLFAYESTLRVPLILAQVGRSSAAPEEGLVSSAPARHVDVVPSILDALSLPAPPALPGRSLLDPAPADIEPLSYFEALSASLDRGWAPLRGVLSGRDKYVDLPLPELYDLQADPAESSNLVTDRAGRARTLEALLADLPASDPLDRRIAETVEVVERLRSLGYVGGAAPAKESYTADDDPKRLAHLDDAIHRGVDLYQRGRAREAIEVYREVIAERPELEMAHRHLAYLHWSLGEVDEAVGTLTRAWEAGVASPAVAGQLGIYLAESGRADEAVPLLEALAAGERLALDTLNALGIAYARRGDAERALETFERVLALDPDNAMALENMGTGVLEAARP